MATFQIAGSSEADVSSSTAPLVVLFERDDAIAVPLLSQLRMAGYDVRSSRTPVELFDILGKHLVALVLVDLGSATAGRREFWVALDAQRRGRAIQVMTFRYSPPGGLFDLDFEQTARAIADVEVHGAHEFQVVIEAVRQRIPLHGGANPMFGLGGQGMMGSLPGGIPPIGAALGVPSPFLQNGAAGFGSQQLSYGFPNSPSVPQFAPYDPAGAYNPYGAQGPAGVSPDAPFAGNMSGPAYHEAYVGSQIPLGFGMSPIEVQMPYAQMNFAAPPGQDAMAGLGARGAPAFAYDQMAAHGGAAYEEAASPFAHPIGANPFSAEIEASPFARPYDMNPFAAETTSSSPGQILPDLGIPQMAPPMTPGQPGPLPSSSPPPFAAAYVAPEPTGAGQRFEIADFERRAAQLSAAYAAQFDIATPPGLDGSGPVDDSGWGTTRDAPSRSFPGFAGSFGGGTPQNGYGGPRTPEPISDVWTPPDADDGDLEGATGVVPEMAYKPMSPAPDAWNAVPHPPTPTPPTPWPPAGGDTSVTPKARVFAPREASEEDATPQLATAPLATPARVPMVYRSSPTEKALSAVLVEGALLDEGKLETLKGIQQMLASVDMNFKLGELALLFRFLSPDQLLAALLVSRGLVSPAQIAGLGRVKQDLAGSGMDYDLETLLSMFNILPEEQLRALRNELVSARNATA